MKPFLEYGWQPQVMSVDGRYKAILTGTHRGLRSRCRSRRDARSSSRGGDRPAGARGARELSDSVAARPRARQPRSTDEAQRKLATLGYVSATSAPVVRKDAPRPVDMRRIFALLDQASGLFVRRADMPRRSRCSRRSSSRIRTTSMPRCALATAHSSLGQDARAVATFQKAAEIAPNSSDVRTYLALHYARGKDWPQAVPLLEQVVAESPDRAARARGAGRGPRASGPHRRRASRCGSRIYAQRDPTPAELVGSGDGDGPRADADRDRRPSSRRARSRGPRSRTISSWASCISPTGNSRRRATRSIACPSTSPGYPMALFKRAQVSVLLHEPDAPRASRSPGRRRTPRRATSSRGERLFQGIRSTGKGPGDQAGPFVCRTARVSTATGTRSAGAADRSSSAAVANSELCTLGWMLYPVWLLPTLKRSSAICAFSRCCSGMFCV